MVPRKAVVTAIRLGPVFLLLLAVFVMYNDLVKTLKPY